MSIAVLSASMSLDERLPMGGPPAYDSTWLGLVDVEMPGYSIHVQEPEHEQHQCEQAHDGQRYD
jgi:hypothetical protein